MTGKMKLNLSRVFVIGAGLLALIQAPEDRPAEAAGSPTLSLVNDQTVIHASAACATPGSSPLLRRRRGPAPAEEDLAVPGRLLVRLRTAAAVESARQGHDPDGCLLTGLPSIDAVSHSLALREMSAPFRTKNSSTLSRVRLLRYAAPLAPSEAASLLSGDPSVTWAEPDYFRRTDAVPSDASYPLQYGLTDINAERAWDVTTGSPSAVIAVIDTGLDRTHPDLAPNVWTNSAEAAGRPGVDDDGNGFVDDVYGWDFVDVDPFFTAPGEDARTPDNDPSDVMGHGTNVAGIAAAAADNPAGALGINIAGVCWTCRVMGLRAGFKDTQASGVILESAWVQALIYATDNGARVANLSFAGRSPSIIEEEAVAYAAEHDVLMVAAAGNLDNTALSYPAAYPGVMAIAATDFLDRKAVFSSFGRWIALAAPGVANLTTAVGNNYFEVSGTSFSAPHVAGAAGLILSDRPGIGAAEMGDLLKTGADNVDAANSNYVGLLGAGRLDAYRSLVGSKIGIANTGLAPLTLTDLRIDPNAPWLTVPASLPLLVDPGTTLYLDPLLDRSAMPCGHSSASVEILSDDPNAPSQTVRVRTFLDCDADGDGHDCPDHGGDDCDDADAEVHPGAPEVCDGPAACDGVTGHDDDCDGRVDEICSCTGRPNAPIVNPPVSASTPEKAAVKLTWIDLADNESGFRILRRRGGKRWVHIANVRRDVQAYLDKRVHRGAGYTYALRAVNGRGASPRVESFYTVRP